MKALFLLLLLGAVALCADKFRADMDGEQVVPDGGRGEGLGFFELDDDNEFKWEISLANVDLSQITAAHLHGGPDAKFGNNAEPLFEIPVNQLTDIKGSEKLTDTEAEWVRKGLTYVAVHTEQNPDGEMRGQVLSTAEEFHCKLDGDNVRPNPVDTGAKGHGKFWLDYETRELEYEIEHNVHEAEAAHVHGPATERETAGPVIVFESVSSPIKGTHQLTEEHMDWLRGGILYVNIHSFDHPDGAIRGQIFFQNDDDWDFPWEWLFVGILLVIVFAVVVAVVVAGLVVFKRRAQIGNLIQKKTKKGGVMDDGISEESLLSEEDLEA